MIYPVLSCSIKGDHNGSPFSRPSAEKSKSSTTIFNKHLAAVKTEAGSTFSGFSKFKISVDMRRIDSNAVVNDFESEPFV
jgi:hypothetical protein